MPDLPFTPMLEPPTGDAVASGALVFSVKGDAVHVAEHDGDGAEADLYLGRLGELDCWAVDLDGDQEPDVVVTPLLALHASVSEAEWIVAGRAVQLLEWRRTHRFCGRCGVETESRARRARHAVPAVPTARLPAPRPGGDHPDHPR